MNLFIFLRKKVNFLFGFEWLIVKQLLFSKSNNKIVSIVTCMSVGAVTFACAGIIVVLGIMNGFSSNIRDKVLGINPHVVLLYRGIEFEKYNAIIAKTKQIPGVITAHPFILGEGLLSFNGSTMHVLIKGVNTEQFNLINKIKNSSKSDYGIIVGSEIMRNLKISCGNFVTLMSFVKNLGPIGFMPKIKKIKILNSLKTDILEHDSKMVYIPLEDAQILFNLPKSITGIEYKLKEPENVIEISNKILNIANKRSFYVRNWMDINKPLVSALKFEKIAMFVIFITMFFIASLLILVSLIMTVLDKSKEIAVLKSIGSTDNSIIKIFIVYGLSIGFLGIFLGQLFGLAICVVLQKINIDFGLGFYHFNKIPINISIKELMFISLSLAIISFLATIVPAFLGARCKPADKLKI